MSRLIQNENEEFIKELKRQIKDNSGYCLYMEKGSKSAKCPKPCKNGMQCECGMYLVAEDYNIFK